MAIYHFSVKVISRANGSSAVAAAAYRAASRLHDQRLDRAHDFSGKTSVVHSEIMLPDGAPEDWRDREKLWNAVEASEVRKDAQLSREVEFAIPREMTQAQGIDLARDFVQREMVDRGMVADLNVHWDIGEDGQPKPHAHVMLTMREVKIGEDGSATFGPKVRDWNRVEMVEHWREAWADHANERLRKQPAVQTTPQDMAQSISAAGEAARAADRDALQGAARTFYDTARDLSGRIASAREADQQERQILWFGGGGAVLGLVVGIILTIITLRIAPESGAAWIMGMDRGQAGQHLLASADPKAWNALQAYAQLGRDNRDDIDACHKQAEQTGKDQRCRLIVKAPEAP